MAPNKKAQSQMYEKNKILIGNKYLFFCVLLYAVWQVINIYDVKTFRLEQDAL